MPPSDARTKADRHFRLLKLFEQPGQRLRTGEIAARLGVSDDTVKRDIDELSLSGRLPCAKMVSTGCWLNMVVSSSSRST